MRASPVFALGALLSQWLLTMRMQMRARAVGECGVWEPRLENCLAYGEIKMLLSNQTLLFESESHFSALLRLKRLETVDGPVQHRV